MNLGFLMAAGDAAHGAADSAGGHAAKSGSAFPPFDATHFSHQFFWFLVAFGILYYVMKNIALPGVEQTLSNRKGVIDADLKAAREAGEAADAARARHEKILAESRAKARASLDDVRNKAATQLAEETAKSDAAVASKVAAAEAKINAMRTEAMANVRTTAADLAIDIAQKIGGVSISRADAEAALDKAGRSAA